LLENSHYNLLCPRGCLLVIAAGASRHEQRRYGLVRWRYCRQRTTRSRSREVASTDTYGVDDGQLTQDTRTLIDDFVETFRIREVELGVPLVVLTDQRTDAKYVECHLWATQLVELATEDVPLDPEEQEDYRANRELVDTSPEFLRMVDDAVNGRSFSNLVAEYLVEYNPKHPLKIIGGQHRLEAIRRAGKHNVDRVHGLKVYFDLRIDQRLDCQLISNTNIDVSDDLIDRLLEARQGPELRDWCQRAGLLEESEDFADRFRRGGPFTVRYARSFIVNFYMGQMTRAEAFDKTETVPVICNTGLQMDTDYEATKRDHPDLWEDDALLEAGNEFARLVKAQREAVENDEEMSKSKDFAEKATNRAVLSAWAYVAGVLQSNPTRRERHHGLADGGRRDPLNAVQLAKARHRTDPDNYRGLGYRTDAKERARMSELFFYCAETGHPITQAAIKIALGRHHTKAAILEQAKLEGKNG